MPHLPAVFLSYASQDADAARRIAEALSAAGINVWFDQSELRGGDAWDRQIKTQIRDCALFLPIISANTQSRLEGYFRREWRNAVDRMHDMDDAKPFLVPIVIDNTTDAEAHVPERFKERQWTHLPDGESTPEFVDRVAMLLAGTPDATTPPPEPPMATQPPRRAAFGKTGGYPKWLTWVFVLGGFGVGIYYSVVRPMLDRRGDAGEATTHAPPPVTDERPYFIGTIAVLPPHVIGGPAERATVADSLHEEILAKLSAMRPFDVVSRTSTRPYGDSETSAPEIGRTLGADFVVEVNLQMSDTQCRVTMQIIEAATDRHLAAEAFNRPLESGESDWMFEQALAWETAIGVYRSLKRQRPPSTASRERLEHVVGALMAESQTLQVRFWGDDGNAPDPSHYDRLMELTREVIAVDPDNAAAHTDRGSFLGHAPYVGQANYFDESWRQELLLTLKQSVAVNGDNVDSQRNLGNYYLTTEGSPIRSLPYLQAAVRLADANAPYANNWPYYTLSSALHQTGQSVAALRVLERAPQAPSIDQLAYWIEPFVVARRYADALAFLQKQAPRLEAGDRGGIALTLAHLRTDTEVRWTGDRSGLRTFLARLETDPFATAGMRARYRLAAGDYPGVLRELAAVEPGRDPYAPDPVEMPLFRGLALARTGNEALAQSFYRSVLKQLTAGPQAEMMLRRMPAIVHSAAAFMHAGLGQREEMRTAIEQARAATDPARNFQTFLQVEYLIALALTQAGATEDACATIDQLLSAPSGESAGSILGNVSFDSLHDTPEFEAVIRKHAAQLKGPAILDTYFAASKEPL